MLRANDVRERFLEFFESKGHTRVRSSSLVPEGDPTLLFTNAGMNQFKGLFLGQEKRAYSRACSSQKCVRAGGKHNDLENVGFTARHHTFFEMLGNFSFGDYFKEDAIAFCWEHLTKDLGLDPKKLWVTIYKDDDEAEKIWKKVTGFGTDKILRFGEKENFWQMGDTGPCGPCSEVHYDQGKDQSCGAKDCGVNCKNDTCGRYLEIWNNVFMQFEQDKSGKRTPLPRPSIDTGMGLERITSILQGKKTNYEIDLFQGIISTVAEIAKKKYGSGNESDASMRVIADHARATAFLIADGVLPSNEGRGYVLRRIMRRAIRHGEKLEVHEPFLHQVAMRVMKEMGSAFPELVEKQDHVRDMALLEEKRFRETMATGLKLLGEAMKKAKSSGEKLVPGDVAFKLHDTYGYPLDLTQVIAAEKGLGVDTAGFEKLMTEQQQRGKSSWTGDRAAEGERPNMIAAATEAAKNAGVLPGVGDGTKIAADALQKAGLDDLRDEFLRWTKEAAATNLRGKSRVLVTMNGSGTAAPLNAGDVGAIVTWWTPFYPEGGGQVGDRGTIVGDKGATFEVDDTQKLGGGSLPPIHFGRVVNGTFQPKDTVELTVRQEHRLPTKAHHTATHLAHSALRNALGTHVKQAGSKVTPDRLRFDFAHFQPVKPEELKRIEREVNDVIFSNTSTEHREMTYAEAMKAGALAFFGDKYGDRVKVLTVGDYSKELCGGTHVSNTGEIGFFRLVSESGIAAGVRRIEAVTNVAALAHAHEQEALLEKSAAMLNGSSAELPGKIEKLLDENKRLLKELEKARSVAASASAGDLVSKARDVGGVKLVSEVVSAPDANALREMAETLRGKLVSGVIVLGAKTADGKATLVAAVSKDLQSKVQAGALIKELAGTVGGRGGGKPDLAQGGGPDADKLGAALSRAAELVAR